MENIKEKLSGVFAPMTTPFEEDKLLFDGLITNIDKMNETGLKGYFVLGTNGEYKSLSVEERIMILKTVARNKKSEKVLMAGTGMESTKETIEMTLKASDAGTDMVSLLMPHFFASRMTDDVLTHYIIDIADASPVPVLIYNNPSVAAGVTVTPQVIQRVSAHPNVVGMKDSSKGNFKSYIEAAKDGLYVLAGSANFFLDLLMAGGIGGVLSLANVFPDECVKMYEAFVKGSIDEAKKINERIVGLNKVVSGTYGVAGVKAAMDMVGFIGGAPRRPLNGLTVSEKSQLHKELRERGFLHKK